MKTLTGYLSKSNGHSIDEAVREAKMQDINKALQTIVELFNKQTIASGKEYYNKCLRMAKIADKAAVDNEVRNWMTFHRKDDNDILLVDLKSKEFADLFAFVIGNVYGKENPKEDHPYPTEAGLVSLSKASMSFMDSEYNEIANKVLSKLK